MMPSPSSQRESTKRSACTFSFQFPASGFQRPDDRVDIVDAAAPRAAADVLQRRPQARVVGQQRIGREVGARRRAERVARPPGP